MVIPDHPDGNRHQKPLEGCGSMLVTMLRPILIQSGCLKLTPRCIGRRKAHIVAVDEIAEENHKVGILKSHDIKNQIPCLLIPTTILAHYIGTPHKCDGKRVFHGRRGCEFALSNSGDAERRLSWLNDTNVITIGHSWEQPFQCDF